MVKQPFLPELIQQYLYHETHDDSDCSDSEPDFDQYPVPHTVSTFTSVVVHMFAPNEQSNFKGMCREHICAVTSWRNGPPRFDCAFVTKDSSLLGFKGLHVVHINLFFSFNTPGGLTHSCALVSWFTPTGVTADQTTGMWIVEPLKDENDTQIQSVIDIRHIICGAHLIGHPGLSTLPSTLTYADTFDAFTHFYVNKFIDYNAHEIAF